MLNTCCLEVAFVIIPVETADIFSTYLAMISPLSFQIYGIV
ncbi:hypothetical protein GCM10007043_23170 [Calditerricola satsumensis]|uniref:Uncharacterized protein n=1 Tax=Calditerricola satsumensis TaxID=373054 RepID=A0A8J3BGB4_9BACI|nr:hypothetical protein GCM10007043_23170 [Calditerricola satsumensis]